MLGPYYRLQMTSLMSITHRATGVWLSLVGVPLLLCWIMAISNGAEAYAAFVGCVGAFPFNIALAISFLCLFYHLFNGIRHLVWDTGRAMTIKSAYTFGWLVLIGTVLATAAVLGVMS